MKNWRNSIFLLRKAAKAKEQLSFYMSQLNDIHDNPDSKIKGLDHGIFTAGKAKG